MVRPKICSQALFFSRGHRISSRKKVNNPVTTLPILHQIFSSGGSSALQGWCWPWGLQEPVLSILTYSMSRSKTAPKCSCSCAINRQGRNIPPQGHKEPRKSRVCYLHFTAAFVLLHPSLVCSVVSHMLVTANLSSLWQRWWKLSGSQQEFSRLIWSLYILNYAIKVLFLLQQIKSMTW